MKATTERHSPDRVRTPEERVIDAMHRFAYRLVADYAQATDRLLEIGFGEGYGSGIVAALVKEYVGVEVDSGAVVHAERKYDRPGSRFLHYGGSALPFVDGTFDLVISFQVLEHVPDAGAFLREARRVLAPGGTVLIVTPNRNHRLDDGERPWNRYHVREFSPNELETEMRQVFDRVEMFGIHGSPAIDAIEKERVAKARRLARLDRLGLRYLVPESLDTKLRSWRRGRSRVRPSIDAPTGVEQMYRSHDTATSLDLLAVGYG